MGDGGWVVCSEWLRDCAVAKAEHVVFEGVYFFVVELGVIKQVIVYGSIVVAFQL